MGGNQGRVSETFDSALACLDATVGIQVIQKSRNYTTSPVGAAAGGVFRNAVVELQTSLSPLELLSRLQAVETELGRVRTVRWGARTLDLDLLFYGDTILSTPTLTIPHPHLWYRRFVLDPLVEIAPDLVHPQIKLSVRELARRLDLRPLPCTLCGDNESVRTELVRQALNAFPMVRWQAPDAGTEILNFWLGGSPAWESLPVHSRINVPAFPTSPWETVRDVLTAALDATRLADQDAV